MSEYIAGSKTTDDWIRARKNLIGIGDPAIWKNTFQEYFETRLQTRYLNPIETIQQYDTLRGEGFSIMAIQCSLIEFLQSTVQGLSYKHCKKGDKLGPYEYSSSSVVFKTFLTTHAPFSTQFISMKLAHDFYVNVRCALLHEARTKGGWRIHANDPAGQNCVVDYVQKIIHRNDFFEALLRFITDYGMRLEIDTSYQEAFIRKFDSLTK